jgi:SAM-dependent methyltransferase
MADFPGKGPELTLVGPQADITFYAERVAKTSSSVLVLGCGTGRLVFGLCDGQRRVVGADNSLRMLAQAEERRQSLDASSRKNVQLVTSDLRSLRLTERFDTVLLPHNGLSLLSSDEDFASVLATVRHHLLPTGTFSFDVVHGRAVGGMPAAHRRPYAPHLRERHRNDTDEASGGIRRWKVRQLGADEVDQVLAREGFVVTERFGGFDGHPFSPSDAVQVVVAAPGESA